jgi:hypothetical protein
MNPTKPGSVLSALEWLNLIDCCLQPTHQCFRYIGGVMVSVIASNAVDWESAHNQDNVS